MPGAEPLKIKTYGEAVSPTGWVATKLQSAEQMGENGTQFIISFPDEGLLTLKRVVKTTPNSFSAEDTWTVNQPIEGFLRTEFVIPYDQLDSVTISNGLDEMTGRDLASVTETQHFLEKAEIEQFTLNNYMGNTLSISFSQSGKFEIIPFLNLNTSSSAFTVQPMGGCLRTDR